jgi:hypothetical protein
MNLFTHMRAFPPGDFKEVIRPRLGSDAKTGFSADAKTSPSRSAVPC